MGRSNQGQAAGSRKRQKPKSWFKLAQEDYIARRETARGLTETLMRVVGRGPTWQRVSAELKAAELDAGLAEGRLLDAGLPVPGRA